MIKPINWFDGYTFDSMSDSYLVDCFDELSGRCARRDDDEWKGEWLACRAELLHRLEGAHG